MFDAGSIVAKLVMDKGDFDESADKSKEKVRDIAKEVKSLSRDLNQLGTKLIATSSLVLGPLSLAIGNASSRNFELSRSLREVNTSFREMVDQVIPSLIPWVNNFAHVFKRASDVLASIPSKIKENVINFLVLSSVLLLVSGVVLKMGALILFLTSRFFTFGGVALAAVGGLVILMWKFDAVGDAVLNTFEAVFYSLKAGFTAIRAVVADVFSSILYGLSRVFKALASLKTPMRDAFKEASEYLSKFSDDLHKMSEDDFKTVQESAERLGDIFDDGKGNWSESFKELKESVDDLMNSSLLSLETRMSSFDEFIGGMKHGLDELAVKFRDFGKLGYDVMNNLFDGMKNLVSDFFFNVFTGQINNIRDVFAEFGRFLLKVISDVIAQLVIAMILKTLITGGTGVKIPLVPTSVRNIPAAADGIEDVPYTGIYKLHAGEEVVQRSGSGSSKGIELTLYNLLTNETIAKAMRSKEGENTIVNVIDANSSRGGAVRRTIKRA